MLRPMTWPTLANHPSIWVRIACDRCGRRGKLRLARLVEQFGADALMVRVREELTRDCRYSHLNKASGDLPKGCRAHFMPPHYGDRRPAPEGD